TAGSGCALRVRRAQHGPSAPGPPATDWTAARRHGRHSPYATVGRPDGGDRFSTTRTNPVPICGCWTARRCLAPVTVAAPIDQVDSSSMRLWRHPSLRSAFDLSVTAGEDPVEVSTVVDPRERLRWDRNS